MYVDIWSSYTFTLLRRKCRWACSWNKIRTYAMSPAVEGEPYSSKSRIRSPNCPCKSPNILIGALSCITLGSLENILSAVSQRSAISLQSRKNCLRTGGFHPRGFKRWAITWTMNQKKRQHYYNNNKIWGGRQIKTEDFHLNIIAKDWIK